MRLDLRSRLSRSGVTIRSNLNSPIHDSMRTERVNAKVIRLFWSHNGLAIPYTLRVENGAVVVTVGTS